MCWFKEPSTFLFSLIFQDSICFLNYSIMFHRYLAKRIPSHFWAANHQHDATSIRFRRCFAAAISSDCTYLLVAEILVITSPFYIYVVVDFSSVLKIHLWIIICSNRR
jgi:hypothetical protein